MFKMKHKRTRFVRASALAVAAVLLVALLPMYALAAAPVARTETATSVNYNTAVIKGSVTNTDTSIRIDSVGIAYSTTAWDPSAIKKAYNGTNIEDFTVTLENLQPNTIYYAWTYYYYTSSITGEGTGNWVQFTTSSAPSGDGGVAKPSYTEHSTTDVTFTSKYTLSGYTVQSMGFVYGSGTNPTLNNSQYTIGGPDTISGTTFSLRLSNLSTTADFYIRAFVYVNEQSGPIYSDILSYRSDLLAPVVTSDSATLSNGSIVSKGTINTSSLSGIREKGFVYSTTSSEPTIQDARIVVSTSDNPYTGSFIVNTSVTNYYIRAYATNNSGATGYGNVMVVAVNTDRPTVTTDKVGSITATTANIEINVTRAGISNVTERGVVYSRTNNNPELNASGCESKSVDGTTGVTTVSLTGLQPNSTYYIRSYAKNNSGVSYGEVREFKTQSADVTLETLEASDIKYSSATANGKITQVTNNTILERGFVYSSTRSEPTTDDLKVSEATSSTGSYLANLTELKQDTKYYVRAYAKTSSGTFYGGIYVFTTLKNEDVSLAIVYVTTDGSIVGTVPLVVKNDAIIEAGSLTPPQGYTISDLTKKYTVTESRRITVLVTQNAPEEKEFMKGAGNYKFNPDVPITRADVAQMIYELSDKKMGSTPLTFKDVPNNHANIAAINYVSSNRIMIGDSGVFRPGENMTRAEIAVVLCTVYKLSGTADCNFTDVPRTFWGYNYIALATQAKMINGNGDGTYTPGSPTTRAAACVLFSNAEKRSLVPLGSTEFTDVPSTHWGYRYIMNAAIARP